MPVHSVYLGELAIIFGNGLRHKHHGDINFARLADPNDPAVAVHVALPTQQRMGILQLPESGEA